MQNLFPVIALSLEAIISLMNTRISTNFARNRWSLFAPPLLLLMAIFAFLYSKNALTAESYISVQKDWFLMLNSELSRFPSIEYNLTQLGDALISLSLLSVFFVKAPKLWESLVSASLVSLLLVNPLKKLFAVPRPAAALINEHFEIIGRQLSGANSLPSGHSVTVFTIITVLMFAWMPKSPVNKISWCFFVVLLGIFIVFTRVGVGAHYPVDVLVGGLLGYICGLLGILISRKFPLWAWIGNRKFYPFFVVVFVAGFVVIVNKILAEQLIVFYLAAAALLFSLYQIITAYVQKQD